ncbi:MAG: hypothetical protein IKG22_09345 [Atopobiaceae bacterium]|nr:hypothetical protein [Atopobiaceae bacterium]
MNKRVEVRKSDRSKRKLFVVDIENAVGAGMIDEESCKSVRNRIERTYHPGSNDLTVLGVSHKNNLFPAHAWDGARVVIREGHDGADLALEDVLSNENVEGRFGEVVIVSGDGLFSGQAFRLRSLGVRVTVDARARQLARVLAFSCTCVRLAPSALAA